MFASESSRLRGRDGGWVYHWIVREVSRDSPLHAVAVMTGATTFQDGDGPGCGVSKVMTHGSPNWAKYLLETLGFQGTVSAVRPGLCTLTIVLRSSEAGPAGPR